MPGVLIVAIDVSQMPRPGARSATVPVRHHPTALVLAIVVRVIGQVVVTAAIAVDPMTVAVTTFMPIAIPVAVTPIFPRVTMLSAIVVAGGFALTAILIANPRAALFADYIIAIVLPILDAGCAVVLPVLDASCAVVLPVLDAGRAIVLPILDASGLMLLTRLLANLGLSRMLFATLIVARLLLMTRLGMRII
jgi:hypothetical protein